MANVSLRDRGGSLPLAGLAGLSVGVILAALLSGLNDMGNPVSRALFYLSGVVTVGASVFPLLLGSRAGAAVATELAAARRVAAGASVVWVFATVACLVTEAAALYVRRPLSPEVVVDYVRAVPTGTVLAVSAGAAAVSCLAALLALGSGDSIPSWLRLALAVLPLVPLPLSGHMRALGSSVAWAGVVCLELHVVAAAAWVGGLLLTVARLSSDRELLARALPRFSSLASGCVFMTALTGAGIGLLELTLSAERAWYAVLFTTGYGYILLCKGLAVVVLGALGAHVRFRLLPVIRDGSPTAVVRWVGWELAVMGAAFGLAVVLTHTSVTAG